MDRISALLEQKGIRPTPNRILVARCLDGFRHPVSIAEIEEDIASIDKSGVFRVIRLFVENDLVHEIDDGSGSLRYELCRGECGHSVSDMHIHFKCVECGKVYCLETEHIPPFNIPEGFLLQSVNFVGKGVCKDCLDSHRSHEDSNPNLV